MTVYPNMVSTPSIGGGPIFANTGVTVTGKDEANDRYPIDPWGNPYLFFAPGQLIISGVTSNETDYLAPVVYSMGPNGVPGNLTTAPVASDYLRDSGVLGTGDDVTWQF